MGYSTCGRHGRRICDDCGACPGCDGSRGLRRFVCPFGWCGTDHFCAACSAKHRDALSVAGHRARGCETSHQRFQAERARTLALQAAGLPVRGSALGGRERVHVLFEYGDGRTVGFEMSGATYEAIPWNTPATPDDYRAHGELQPAASTFAGGVVLKQV